MAKAMATTLPPQPPRLLDQLRESLTLGHYSPRTIEAYTTWTRRFILFNQKRHPKELGEAEVRAFLTHLAVNRSVAASTQNQALGALLYLYKHLIKRELSEMGELPRGRTPTNLPVVLSRPEVRSVLAKLNGTRGSSSHCSTARDSA
jgi:site-specific recombinase XerD